MAEIIDHSDYHMMVEEKIVNLNKENKCSIREVYFDKDNNPIDYSNTPVIAEFNDFGDLSEFIKKAEELISKEIYWVGEKFPQTFEVKNNGNKEN